MKLVLAPNNIFKKIAQPVEKFDDDLAQTCQKMKAVMELHRGIGIGANMVGVLQRIIIVPNPDDPDQKPIAMVNPEITWKSDEKQIYHEASLSFPGIEAEIARPYMINITYFTETGEKVETKASAFLSTIIQHEIDYLDGKVFLDYLPKLKSKMLRQKMMKFMKKGTTSQAVLQTTPQETIQDKKSCKTGCCG